MENEEIRTREEWRERKPKQWERGKVIGKSEQEKNKIERKPEPWKGGEEGHK